MNRNKGLVVILSHADTEDKIEILIESINSIKKQNYDILISSHINIPDYINDMVDYFIYDKENELINDDISPIFIWMKAVGYEHHYPIKNYHAYAVLELIKNASFFAESKGYENVHFINYDYVINDENILLEHNKLLVDNDIISYDWTNYGGLNSKYITSGFFSVRNKNFLNLIKNIKTKEDYHKHSRPIFEEFLYDYVINNSDMKVYHLPVSILFDNLPPDEIKKSTTNKIDTKSLLDNHIINNFDNENLNQKLYLYLIKDEDNNYYILIRFDFKILKVNFKIGDIEYDFYTNPGINLIPIKFEQLEKNILIKILGNDNIVERQINQFTIPAYCVISEKSYIFDIFELFKNNILNSNKEVVLSIWDRDYNWIDNLSSDIKITKYNKNLNTLKEDHIFISKNVGRYLQNIEDEIIRLHPVHTFFYHIVNRYDTLSEYTFFAQDYIEDCVKNYSL